MTIDQFEPPTDDGGFYDQRYGDVKSGTSTPTVSYVNEAGIPDSELEDWLNARGRREIASVIEKWSQSLSSEPPQTTLDVFNRNKWQNKNHVHALMSQCAWAVESDDILSTLADVLEGLMWQKCRFELFDSDQQSMWNQWAADVDLDACFRKMGREEFKISQFYVGLWWEDKTYDVEEDPIEDTIKEFEAKRDEREQEEKVKAREEFISLNSHLPGFITPHEVPELEDTGPGRGNRKRKKKFSVEVPTAMTIFDPLKVIPVGTMMFGRERFAYVADYAEEEAFAGVMRGEIADGTVLQLIERKYTPNASDIAACADLGISHDRLWLFKKEAAFRHTETKADYERYAVPRLKSILPLLEMKDHLRASDRASLIGSTNFIVVITKGSDKLPAKAAEIANLHEQARVIARLPVLIGDHRLHVEIVSPSIDNTLQQSRWEVLDSRLVFRALRSFSPVVQGGNSSGTGVSEMSRVIAKGLESRRHMINRTLERRIFKMVMDRNEGVLDEFPSVAFTPKRITLDFKTDVIAQMLKLRDRGDISRETTLEEVDMDQDVEVLRRARERVVYDRVFESATPHSSPNANPYGVSQPPTPPGQPGGAPSNVGPSGQPRTEGGRPAGATDKKARTPKAEK